MPSTDDAATQWALQYRPDPEPARRRLSAGLQEATAYYQSTAFGGAPRALGAADDAGYAGEDAPAGQQGRTNADPRAAQKQTAHEREEDQRKGAYVLYNIFEYFTAKEIQAYAPGRIRTALTKLYQARVGRGLDGATIPPSQGVEDFDAAVGAIPGILAMADADQRATLAKWRSGLVAAALDAEATARVERALLIRGRVFEIADDSEPHEQASLLRAVLPDLVETLSQATEQYIRYQAEAESVAHAYRVANHLDDEKETAKLLAHWKHVLSLADGWLKLSDAEFQHEITHIQSVIGGIRTYSELVKAITSIGAGAIGLTASIAQVVGFATQDVGLAAAASGIVAKSAHLFGNVIAGIEIVHGIFTILDPKASRQEKIDAGVGIASSGAYFVLGSAASIAIAAPYLMVRLLGHLYSEAVIGWEVGILREMFDRLSNDMDAFVKETSRVRKASQLAATEKDPAKAAALTAIATRSVTNLGRWNRSFLEDCLASVPGRGIGSDRNQARIPGNVPLFVELFAPLQSRKTAAGMRDVLAVADGIVADIKWCFLHAPALPKALATNQRLSDIGS